MILRLALLQTKSICFSQVRFLSIVIPRCFCELTDSLVRCTEASVRRPSASSSFTMLKDLPRNRFVNQSHILYGASLGRGNERLFAASGLHDQDGRHAHIW